jgi:hypothetical protein
MTQLSERGSVATVLFVRVWTNKCCASAIKINECVFVCLLACLLVCLFACLFVCLR